MHDRRAWRKRLLDSLGLVTPALLSGALRLLARTLRVEDHALDPLVDCWKRRERVIVVFWHNRLLLMPTAYRGTGICVLNSQHRDGEIATRALERWGIRSVRGSATRGGVAGFLKLVDAYRHGYDLAVVPDGPRGPRYAVKPGVVHLAKATGARIFPVSYAAAWSKRLRSWDQLIIPLPFSRIVFTAGAPMVVDRLADEAEIERHRRDLETTLNAITRAAEDEIARRRGGGGMTCGSG